MNDEISTALPAPRLRPEPRLAFVDLDDTLLGPDKTISRENLAALDRLRESGVEIVVASGRHHHNIRLFRDLGALRWIVSSQGAVVGHATSGLRLTETVMAPALAAEICDRGRRLGLTLLAYDRHGAFAEQRTAWTDLYARKAGWVPALAGFSTLPPEGFVKILWSGEPERIRRLAREMAPEVRGRFQMVVTEPELLEFLAPGATKASGAAALADHLGFDSGEALAFGDGNNDVEILQWAGVSVAMAHGREGARRAARFVSPPGPPETAFARAVDLVLP